MIRNRNPSNFPSCFHQASINFFQESSVVHDCTSSLEFVPRNKKLRNRHLEAKLHTTRGSNQTHRNSFISWKGNAFLNACNGAVDIVAHAAEAHKLDPLKVNFVIRFEILVRNNYVITSPEHPTPTPLFFERQNVICQYPIPRPSALSYWRSMSYVNIRSLIPWTRKQISIYTEHPSRFSNLNIQHA